MVMVADTAWWLQDTFQTGANQQLLPILQSISLIGSASLTAAIGGEPCLCTWSAALLCTHTENAITKLCSP